MDSGVHQDVFAHCDDLQYTTSAAWYFHRSGNTSVEGWKHLKDGNAENKKCINPRPNVAFRGGTFKGLDITFGAENKQFGGVLIRSIQSLKAVNSLFSSNANGKGKMYGVDELIQGPCKCVDALLKDTGFDDIKSLTKSDKFNMNIFGDDNNVMYLDLASNYNIKKSTKKRTKRIDDDAKDDETKQDEEEMMRSFFHCSPRVGLSLKIEKALCGKELYEFQSRKQEFVMAPYRSIRTNCLSKIKKYKPCIALSIVFRGYYRNKQSEDQSQCNKHHERALDVYSKTKLDSLINQYESGQKNKQQIIDGAIKKFPTTNDGLAKLFGALI